MNLRIFAALILFPFFAAAQTSTIKGVLFDNNNQPLQNVTVVLKETSFVTQTDNTGNFVFKGIPYAAYDLGVEEQAYINFTHKFTVNAEVTDLATLTTGESNAAAAATDADIPVIEADETESQESSSQAVSSLLNGSRDVFANAITFEFSDARYKFRGYDDENFESFINGAPATNMINGRAEYEIWSGLNDMMRSRESVLGMGVSTFAYGGVGGSNSIDARASKQRKQLQATYTIANRTYDNRFMLSYGSGILNKGWAFAASLSKRWANEAFVKGSYYDGIAWFASVSKIINKHEFSLTGMQSISENGKTSPVTKEVYDLAGTHYFNPNWGYLNGEVRNSNIGKNNNPFVVLMHDWKVNTKTNWQTSVSYLSGKREATAFDWYHAPDPRSSYYSYLPSALSDSLTSEQVKNLIESNPDILQIQWDNIYNANYYNIDSVENADGVSGKTIVGKRAQYIIESRTTETNQFTFNSFLNHQLKENINVSGGLSYNKQVAEFYKTVNDLLGADFYVDINKYAEDDTALSANAIYNDISAGNNVLYEDDKFGYDYEASVGKANFWSQAVVKNNKADLFFGINLSNTSFYRNGLFKNGLFPDNSFGKSDKENFFNYGAKVGLTAKLNGRNYIIGNVAYQTRAPFFEDVYVSPRTRDLTVDDIKSENIIAMEGGYLLRAPRLKAKAVAYYTVFDNGIRTQSFYVEGVGQNTNGDFLNFSQTGIKKTHAGIELAADANLGYGFTATGVASIGQYYYSSQPKVTVTVDNTNEVLLNNETVYAENLHVANGPQSAYSLGLGYRSKKFWFLNATLNYYDNIYLDYSPARKTQQALDLIDKDSELYNYLLGQTRAGSQMLLGVRGGWSYKLNNKFKSIKRPTFFLINIGVNNLLDNQDLILFGFEQGRIRKDDLQNSGLDLFGPKYSYGYGRTYFINLIFRMN